MEEEKLKKPVYEYHIVAPIFENSRNYNNTQIMEILNIKRTAYYAWWEKYEKDKAYTSKKVEKELVNLKEKLKEKEEELLLVEKALKEIHNIDLITLLNQYTK